MIRGKEKTPGDETCRKIWTSEQLSEDAKALNLRTSPSKVIFQLLDIKRGQAYSI